VLAIFTLILAVTSVFQSYYIIRADKRAAKASRDATDQLKLAAGQLDAAEKQRGVMREQFFADHRPRLILRDVFFTFPDNYDNLTFEISNIGESVAIITTGFVHLGFVQDPRDFKSSVGKTLGPLIHAGFKPGQLRPLGIGVDSNTTQSLEVLKSVTGDAVRAKAIRRYKGGHVPSGHLYFYGMVRYVDGRGEEFGTEHLAVFRRRWSPDAGLFLRTSGEDDEYSD
jgi:hypothetical protein